MEQRRTAEFSCKPSPDQGQKLKNGHPTSPSRPSLHRRHPVLHEGNPTTTTTTTIADTHISPGHRERPAPMTPTHRAQREQHNLVRREKPLRSAFGAGLYADTDSPGKPAKPLPSTRLVLHGHPSRPLPEDRTRPRDLQSQTPKFRAARAADPSHCRADGVASPEGAPLLGFKADNKWVSTLVGRFPLPLYPTIADTHLFPGHRERPAPMTPTHRAQREQHNLVRREKPLRSAPGALGAVCGHPFSEKTGQAPPSSRSVLHGHPNRPLLPRDRARPRDPQSQTPKFRAARAADPSHCRADGVASPEGAPLLGFKADNKWVSPLVPLVRRSYRSDSGSSLGSDQLRATTVGLKAQLPLQEWPWMDP